VASKGKTWEKKNNMKLCNIRRPKYAKEIPLQSNTTKELPKRPRVSYSKRQSEPEKNHPKRLIDRIVKRLLLVGPHQMQKKKRGAGIPPHGGIVATKTVRYIIQAITQARSSREKSTVLAILPRTDRLRASKVLP